MMLKRVSSIFIKRLLGILLIWVGCNFSANTQVYQRMLISTEALNGLSVKGEISELITARCLDETRHFPNSTTINNILDGAQNVTVFFTDGYPPKPLSDLLGRPDGIDIVGASIFEILKSNSSDLKVKLKNRTGHPFRLISHGNIQVGTDPESAAIYEGETQGEIWLNTNIVKLYELKQGSTKGAQGTLSQRSLNAREKLLEKLVREFEIKNGLTPTGKLTSPETKDKFNEIYNEYLSNKAKFERDKQDLIIAKLNKTKQDFLSAYDIGIQGDNPDQIIHIYTNLANIDYSTSWEDMQLNIRKEYDAGIYYLYHKDAGIYKKYIRSLRLKHFGYTYSDYTLKNIKSLEDALFKKQIDIAQIHILNFLSRSEDDETFKVLEKYFPNNHSDFSAKNYEKLVKRIKNEKIKYLFCFGHYSNGKIFTVVGGKTIYYDIEMLYKIGKAVNVEVFLIGCESSFAAGGRSGTTITVNSLEILTSLFNNLSLSRSFGEFLSSFGEEFRLVYEFEEKADAVRIIKTMDYEPHNQSTNNGKKAQDDKVTSTKSTSENRNWNKRQEYYEFDKYKTQRITLRFPPHFFYLPQNINDDDKRK